MVKQILNQKTMLINQTIYRWLDRGKAMHRMIVVVALMASAGTMSAQEPTSAPSVDEARRLAEDGETGPAVEMLGGIVAENPKNTDAALFMSELLWNSGRDSEAMDMLRSLKSRGVREATLRLAEISADRLEVEEARSLLSAYRATLKKGKRQIAEDMSGDLEDRLERIEMMLDRVQNIEVIDSVDVDADEFFARYPLSPAAGRLGGMSMLPSGLPGDETTVAHIPESGTRIVWSAPDNDGNLRLYGSSALLGGEWENARPLGENLAEGGDVSYPFLMPDGITLYFANDGENSIGGYDIFQTREGDGEYLQPANLGFPFNSPYNDYMLAIDEFTGVGWFATDRNRHPGKVTIYTFIPQELRVNVPFDSPQLTSLARLDNIAATRNGETDYAAVKRRIAEGARMSREDAPQTDFLFPLPGNRTYTSLSDFRDGGARKEMELYLAKQKKYAGVLGKLEALREAYAKGDRSQADLILQLESQLDNARAELKSMRDKIIRMEVKAL